MCAPFPGHCVRPCTRYQAFVPVLFFPRLTALWRRPEPGRYIMHRPLGTWKWEGEGRKEGWKEGWMDGWMTNLSFYLHTHTSAHTHTHARTRALQHLIGSCGLWWSRCCSLLHTSVGTAACRAHAHWGCCFQPDTMCESCCTLRFLTHHRNHHHHHHCCCCTNTWSRYPSL